MPSEVPSEITSEDPSEVPSEDPPEEKLPKENQKEFFKGISRRNISNKTCRKNEKPSQRNLPKELAEATSRRNFLEEILKELPSKSVGGISRINYKKFLRNYFEDLPNGTTRTKSSDEHLKL